MSKQDKSQQFGPDQPRSPVSADRHRLAMGQHAGESRVPQHGVPGLQHLEHGAPPAADAATLHLTAAHPENAMNTDAHGRVPSLTVQEVQASQAATELGQPGDFRSHPMGAAGIGGREDFHAAPINAGSPVAPRPGGPAATPFDRQGGELQSHSPDVQAPGWEHSTRAPGEGMNRFGRGNPAA